MINFDHARPFINLHFSPSDSESLSVKKRDGDDWIVLGNRSKMEAQFNAQCFDVNEDGYLALDFALTNSEHMIRWVSFSRSGRIVGRGSNIKMKA